MPSHPSISDKNLHCNGFFLCSGNLVSDVRAFPAFCHAKAVFLCDLLLLKKVVREERQWGKKGGRERDREGGRKTFGHSNSLLELF